ncbi:MAG: molybdopterin molybdotransferase MoeA [Rhodoferax sp.]|nr:molybdopterin molybdotransferase MoeA [Rhodoferax sp.]
MKTLDEIAAQLQAYDPQSMTVSGVQTFLSQLVSVVRDTETVPLIDAMDRVLAQDLVSPVSVPPHDNSAMDGYAFDGSQLTPLDPHTPLRLAVVGTALAGKAWQGQLQPGQCIKIMTGAILPPGLDTVVPQELVHQSESGIEVAAGLVKPGDNRRLCGEDLALGKPALRRGDLLTPARLGLAASVGVTSLVVVRRLRVAYFSTGDEILSSGEVPREGAVYDSNRYTVLGLLRRLGCEVIDMGVVRDDPDLLEAAFTQGAVQADAIITSGGVSVGEADFTKVMMKRLGDVAFWRIAMRPGRPMAVGRIFRSETDRNPVSGTGAADPGLSRSGGAVVFGLPGNPVAVMVTFLAFVRPALLQMMGANPPEEPLLMAHSQESIRKKPGRTEYQRGLVWTAADGSLQCRTTGNQGSGVLSSMVRANALILLQHDQANVAPGDLVTVWPLHHLV